MVVILSLLVIVDALEVCTVKDDDINCLLVGVNVVVPPKDGFVVQFGNDVPEECVLEVKEALDLALLTLTFELATIAFSFCTFGSEFITLVNPTTLPFFALPFNESLTAPVLTTFDLGNGFKECTCFFSFTLDLIPVSPVLHC